MSNELNNLIREIADDYPESDPREIAMYVAKLTPQDQVNDFYTEALVPVVRSLPS
jgi:hypothetical protein